MTVRYAELVLSGERKLNDNNYGHISRFVSIKAQLTDGTPEEFVEARTRLDAQLEDILRMEEARMREDLAALAGKRPNSPPRKW